MIDIKMVCQKLKFLFFERGLGPFYADKVTCKVIRRPRLLVYDNLKKLFAAQLHTVVLHIDKLQSCNRNVSPIHETLSFTPEILEDQFLYLCELWNFDLVNLWIVDFFYQNFQGFILMKIELIDEVGMDKSQPIWHIVMLS